MTTNSHKSGFSHSASPLRLGVRAAVACTLAAIVTNTWFVEGLFVPLVVHGGSMSPGLLGAHRVWHCAECGERFACNLESLPAAGRAVTCVHCGAANDPAHGVDAVGNRLLVDRSAFWWRQPQRWETVVARGPDDQHPRCVKRVVGLPGETIEISGGDVYVDGCIACKDLATLRAMAVRVSPPEATDRWVPGSNGWRCEDGWFVHDDQAGDAPAWLSYHHREHTARQESRQPIYDSSPLDQAESRLLNPVDDVLLRLEVVAAPSSQLHLRATHRGSEFELVIDTARSELVLKRDKVVARRTQVGDLAEQLAKTKQLEFALADGRLQLALAGRLVLAHDVDPRSAGPLRQPRLSVGATGPLRVGRLEVLRDVYYTATRPSQYRLGDGEYFLLGDNSAHSQDSRDWSMRGGVPGGLLLGPALAW